MLAFQTTETDEPQRAIFEDFRTDGFCCTVEDVIASVNGELSIEHTPESLMNDETMDKLSLRDELYKTIPLKIELSPERTCSWHNTTSSFLSRRGSRATGFWINI